MGQAMAAVEAADLAAIITWAVAWNPILLSNIGRRWISGWILPIHSKAIVDERDSKIHLESEPTHLSMSVALPLMAPVAAAVDIVLDDAIDGMDHAMGRYRFLFMISMT